jgi:hypothetical protein
MGLLNTLFAVASGISSVFAGQAATKDIKQLMKFAKIALICVVILTAIFTFCFLSIGIYTTMLIVQEITAS